MTARDRYDEILAERARKLALGTETLPRSVEASIAAVSVGGEAFGIPVDALREIVPAPPISRLPVMAPWVLGLVQIRGELISVIDSAKILHATANPEPRFVAVVDTSSGPLGLSVDAVSGLREIYSDEIAEALHANEILKDRPLRFTTKDLVSVLDIDRLATNRHLAVEPPSSNATSPSTPAQGVGPEA